MVRGCVRRCEGAKVRRCEGAGLSGGTRPSHFAADAVVAIADVAACDEGENETCEDQENHRWINHLYRFGAVLLQGFSIEFFGIFTLPGLRTRGIWRDDDRGDRLAEGWLVFIDRARAQIGRAHV